MGVRKELDSVKQLWKNRHELRVEDAGIAAWFGLVRLVVEVSHSLDTIGSICLREWQGYGADSSLYIHDFQHRFRNSQLGAFTG